MRRTAGELRCWRYIHLSTVYEIYLIPVFDQLGVVLKKRSVEATKSTLAIDESSHLKQLLEIGKPALQDVHLVVHIGDPLLQQPCLCI